MEGEEGPGLLYKQIRQALEEAGMLHKYKYFPIENPIEFDRKATKEIEKCDLFIGGIGGFLSQVKKAKKLGAKVLSLRFSSHHLYQQRVLQDIYARYGRKQFGLELYRTLREYDQADYFLVVSKFCKYTYTLKGVSPKKVFVVHPGVAAEKFKYAKPTANTDFKVLFVGTNPIRKGLPFLLEAWDQLEIKGKLINRSGIVSPSKNNVVSVPQWVSLDDMGDLYRACSLTILPSLEDPFALTNLESMSCGRPIILTKVTGAADIITDYKEGILIPSCDVKAIKKAILYFYENREELVRMGVNARKKAEEYPWSRFREGVVGVVKKILENEKT